MIACILKYINILAVSILKIISINSKFIEDIFVFLLHQQAYLTIQTETLALLFQFFLCHSL